MAHKKFRGNERYGRQKFFIKVKMAKCTLARLRNISDNKLRKIRVKLKK